MSKIILMISIVFLSGCGTSLTLIKDEGNCKLYQLSSIQGYQYWSTCGIVR